MSLTPYATPDDYARWSGLPIPSGSERLLWRATELIDDIVTARFTVDADGRPVKAHVADALRKATCAQVRFWTETGEEHDVDGLAGTSVNIGNVTSRRPPRVAPQATRILRGALLL